MRDDAELDDRRKRGKKYGGWAMDVSDAEAEETFQNYSIGIQLLKQIVEGVFGKNHTYYVENDSYAGEEGIHLEVYPELGKHFCRMEITVELDANPRMMVRARFGEYLKSIKSFDCDFDELLKEIDSESNAWDYGGDFTPWELSCDAEGELEWDDDAVDKPKYEASKTKVLKTISDILQQKASIEITPTLDISIEKYIYEKYGIGKRTNHP